MRRLAGPASLLITGASLLLFALTADVWRQAEPFRTGVLTNQQALPAESESPSRPKERSKAAARRPRAQTVETPLRTRVGRIEAARESTAQIRRRNEPTASLSHVVPPAGSKAPSRRKPPAPLRGTLPSPTPAPPATGGSPAPPEAPPAPPTPPQSGSVASASAAPPQPAPDTSAATAAAQVPPVGAAPPPRAVRRPADVPSPPLNAVEPESEKGDDDRDDDDVASDGGEQAGENGSTDGESVSDDEEDESEDDDKDDEDDEDDEDGD